jgi:hypothetical protein
MSMLEKRKGKKREWKSEAVLEVSYIYSRQIRSPAGQTTGAIFILSV